MQAKLSIGLVLAILGALLVTGLAAAQGPNPYYYGGNNRYYPPYLNGYQPGFYTGPYDGYYYDGYRPGYVYNGNFPDYSHNTYLSGGFRGGTAGGFYSGPYYCVYNPYRGTGYDIYNYAGGNYYYMGYSSTGCPSPGAYYRQQGRD